MTIEQILNWIFNLVGYIGFLLFFIGSLKKHRTITIMGFILKVLCFFTNIVAVPLFGFTGVQIVGHIMPFMSTSFIGSIIGNIIDLSIWTILSIITMKQIKSNTNQESTINQSVQTKFEQNTNQFTDDIFVKLNEYKKLLDIGAITQEEFDLKKKELL